MAPAVLLLPCRNRCLESSTLVLASSFYNPIFYVHAFPQDLHLQVACRGRAAHNSHSMLLPLTFTMHAEAEPQFECAALHSSLDH